jgi:hypothetical protein
MEQDSENKPVASGKAGSGQHIDLSMRLFLTGPGAISLRDKTNIRRSVDAAGNELPSLAAGRVLASNLKEHIITSRINQIELIQEDLIVRKNELIDLTKLIMYSLLYRLYPLNLLDILTKQGITFPHVDARSEQNWITSNPKEYHELKLDIFNRSKAVLVRERQMAETNPIYRKKAAASVAVKLLNMIPIRVYRALLISKEGPTRETIVKSAVALIDRYLDRTYVSDCLAMAFLEWVECIEKANLDRLFSLWRKDYEERMRRACPAKNVTQALADDSPYQRAILDFADQHDMSVNINWKFGGSQQLGSKADGKGGDNMLRIRLVSKGLIGDWIHSTIQTQFNAAPPAAGASNAPATDEKGVPMPHTRLLKAEGLRHGIEIFMQTIEDKDAEETTLSLSMRINPIG